MKSLMARLVVATLYFTLVTSYAAASASNQPVTPVRENPGSLPILISLHHVSDELHLTSLQKNVMIGLLNDYRSAARRLIKMHHQKADEVAETQKKLEKLAVSYNQRAIDVLTPVQRDRLREVERQVLGGTLLVAPSEQKLLGLSEEQKQKIEKIHQDGYQKAMNINTRANEGKLDYHRQISALRQNRKQHGAAMLSVLTPEQRRIWEVSQGKKLVF